MKSTVQDFDPLTAAQLGTPVVVSELLPFAPTPGEDARRIVRHGYAAARDELGRAAYFPDTLGDIGPKPGEKTHALWGIHDKLFVSQELHDRIRETTRRRAEQAMAAERRRQQELADLRAIATTLGVRKVTAHREPDYRRTLYRAHLEPEGATWAGGPQVRIEDHELARHPNTTAIIVDVATRLRAAIDEQPTTTTTTKKENPR